MHNCRITGIEGYLGGIWNSLNALYVLGATVIICNLPFVLNDGSDDYTILGYSTTANATLEEVEKVRIHYIEIDGVETVTT